MNATSITTRMAEMNTVLLDLRHRELAALRPHPYNGEYPDTLADELMSVTGFRLRPEYSLDAIEVLHGHLHRVYRSGDYVGLTFAGSLAYEPAGERTWDHDGISPDADLVLGCPRIGYGYRLRAGRRVDTTDRFHAVLWREQDMVSVLDEIERRLPDLIRRVEEIEADAAERRKAFGREINSIFRALGADKSVRDAWWSMHWKREVTPEQFILFCRKAEQDTESLALALVCQSRADLERIGWMVRPSVPRTEALLRAVAKATGVKPASTEEWAAWKAQPRKWLFE